MPDPRDSSLVQMALQPPCALGSRQRQPFVSAGPLDPSLAAGPIPVPLCPDRPCVQGPDPVGLPSPAMKTPKPSQN